MRFREYFDRTYIINLPERSDRRADMMVELERAGLELEPGRVEFFSAVRPREAAGFANAGYHGCYRSHLDVFKAARAAGAGNLLVLEDDAALAPRFHSDEAALVAQLRGEPWGMVYFGHKLEETADRPTVLKRWTGGVMLTHFYAVNGWVFDRLIEHLEKILRRPSGHPDGGPMSIDGAFYHFLSRNRDVPYFIASPNLAVQRSSRSDLAPKWFDGVPGLRGAAGAMRRVKRWLKHRA
jgi:glycosyl transferase family 25